MLQTAINVIRLLSGLPNAAFTDPSLAGVVAKTGDSAAVNVNEEGLTSYWATVCVLLKRAIQGERGELLRGYYVNIGLWTLTSAQATQLALQAVRRLGSNTVGYLDH